MDNFIQTMIDGCDRIRYWPREKYTPANSDFMISKNYQIFEINENKMILQFSILCETTFYVNRDEQDEWQFIFLGMNAKSQVVHSAYFSMATMNNDVRRLISVLVNKFRDKIAANCTDKEMRFLEQVANEQIVVS